MNYISYLKSAIPDSLSYLKGLDASTKISILAVLAFLALAAYWRSRDNASNNIRRAREHHKKAVELHEKGKTAEAAEHYQKASEYREKAEDQQ